MPASNPRRFPAILSRRQALGRALALGAFATRPHLLTGSRRPTGLAAGSPWAQSTPADAASALMPTIRPRADWAGDRGVAGEIVPEDDVRFLLVHHTASTNDYTADQVADQIRGFYEFHTGPEKGWPDVAYNFFIDRFGGIWEGRQGSLAGPVRGDATGGSQGYSQLCSLIGNFQETPMTAEQQTSLTRMLAWLGERYQVDTSPGATVTFASRGSNRWPAGQEVTARTISGHREMSLTSCPGDQAFALIADVLPTDATALRTTAAATAATTSTSTTAPSSTTVSPSSEASPTPSSTPTPPTSDEQAAPAVTGADDGNDRSRLLLLSGAGAAVVAAVVGLGSRLTGRRRHSPPEPPDEPGGADGYR